MESTAFLRSGCGAAQREGTYARPLVLAACGLGPGREYGASGRGDAAHVERLVVSHETGGIVDRAAQLEGRREGRAAVRRLHVILGDLAVGRAVGGGSAVGDVHHVVR